MSSHPYQLRSAGQRERGELADFAAGHRGLVCEDARAGPVGGLARVRERLALGEERLDELVGEVRVGATVAAALREGQVVFAFTVDALGREALDLLREAVGVVGHLDLLRDLRLGLLGRVEDGLFAFGDVDGTGTEVRLQHPLGVAWTGRSLIAADTYNSKIKVIDPASRTSTTLLGSVAGFADGAEALFYEPGGVDYANGTLYVADTNNHVIRLVDLATNQTSTLILKGIDRFTPPPDQADYRGMIVDLGSADVSAGNGTVVIDITLPPDHKVNEEAPSSVEWLVSGDVATFAEPIADLTGTTLPIEVPVVFNSGEGRVTADITLVWCADDAESLCFIEQLRIGLVLSVGAIGPSEIVLPYAIELPDI